MQLPLHSSLEGLAIVRYHEGHSAEDCVQKMKDRIFDGRNIRAQVLKPQSSPDPLSHSPLGPSLVPDPFDDSSLSLDPSVIEAAQDVEDFLNSLL